MPIINFIKDKRIIFVILGIIIVAGLIYFIFANPFKKTEVKTYQTLKLTSFKANFNTPNDFQYLTSRTLATPKENFIYKANTNGLRESIRQGALKLGLSNESENPQQKTVIWTKAGVNNLSGDYISYNQQLQILNVRYANGINSQNVSTPELYNYFTDFFSIPKQEVSISSNTVSPTAVNIISYKAKFNGKDLYFQDADEIYAKATLKNGKLLQLFMYVVPTDTEKKYEIQPLTKINADNIDSKYYYLTLTPNENTSASELGSEQFFYRPAKVGSTEESSGYLYYQDNIEGQIIVPLVIMTGNYTDGQDYRGRSLLLLVNQGG